MLAGEPVVPMRMRLEPVVHILDQLSEEQLSGLFNVTGTRSKLDLLLFLNKTNMTVGGGGVEPSFGLFPEYRIKKFLVLYVSPVLLLLGTLGNLFSFIVLRRKPLLKVSSYTYLASLAVIDTLVLYIGLLRVWLAELTGFDYQNSGDWICKLSVVLGYVASDLSVWLIIAVTIERYIVVCFPFKASAMCNTSRARRVIASLALLMLAINFHFFWTSGIGKNGDHEACMAAPRFHQLVEEIWPWVDAFIYSFFPFGIIMTLNALIVREVARARSNRLLMSGSDQAVYGMESGRGSGQCTTAHVQQHHTARGRDDKSKLTALLLTVSFTFLLLTLPNSISLIITRFWNKRVASDTGVANDSVYKRLAQFTLARTVTELLMYANHSVNFFLYCATGHKFRQQVLGVLRVICSHAKIGRLRRGAGHGAGGWRSRGKSGYDADGSSFGGGLNMDRGCYGYSMSLRRTSATALAGNEGLRINQAPAGSGVTRGMGGARRSSCLSNDVNLTYVEADGTDSSFHYSGEVENGFDKVIIMTTLKNSAQNSIGEGSKKVELYRKLFNKSRDNATTVAATGKSRSQYNTPGCHDLLNGTRCLVNGNGCSSSDSNSVCYQMSPLGDVRNGSIGNGHAGFMNRPLDKSASAELSGKPCQKQAPRLIKPFNGISLFSKCTNENTTKSSANKSKNALCGGRQGSSLVRTEGHPPPSGWFKRSKSSSSSSSHCGNDVSNGGVTKGACHGCKLHYYSSKRRKSNPIRRDSDAARQTHSQKENEYVLLTPEMHWCDAEAQPS